jgi:hypothetical protein
MRTGCDYISTLRIIPCKVLYRVAVRTGIRYNITLIAFRSEIGIPHVVGIWHISEGEALDAKVNVSALPRLIHGCGDCTDNAISNFQPLRIVVEKYIHIDSPIKV